MPISLHLGRRIFQEELERERELNRAEFSKMTFSRSYFANLLLLLLISFSAKAIKYPNGVSRATTPQ